MSPAIIFDLRRDYRSRITRAGLFFSLIAILPAGCMVGPDHVTPNVQAPDNWSSPHEAPEPTVTTQPAEAEISLSAWWGNLDDPVLSSLIERALDENLDLQLADARIRRAIALRGASFAELFPAIGLDSSYLHQRTARNRVARRDSSGPSATLSKSASNITGLGPPAANLRFGETSATISPPRPGDPAPNINVTRSRTFGGPGDGFRRDSNLYETMLGATWEIDVWGNIRRSIEAADADVLSSIEDRHSVLVGLVAEVARNYIVLRGTQRQLEITRENIDIQRTTVQTSQTRFAANLATGTDVLQAITQLKRTESEVPPLEALIQDAAFRLSVLLGQHPSALLEELIEQRPMPSTPDMLAIGLPSDLLRRRPDIRAAEQRLAAETALIGVEIAELFPRFSLTASFGLQTADADRYLHRDSLAWGFGPAVRWRLLEFGRIVSSIRAQEESQQEALIIYHQTVLNALQEVESYLATYLAERRRVSALEEVNEANRRAFDLAKEEYAVGMLGFLSVLDTQRSLFANQTELIQSRQQSLINLVNLYEALGGGWYADLDARDMPRDEPYAGERMEQEAPPG